MKPIVISAIVIVLIAVVGVGAFFAGSAYGSQQAQNTRAAFFSARQGGANPGQGGANSQGFGRPAAIGSIKSISGNTLVVTQQDGTSVTVTVDAQTAIQKTVSGALSDLQPGERITVLSDQTGTSVTARSIQLRAGTQTQ